ncbi:MAG: Integral rane protein TerC [Bacteroidota bacterium]|nr:Integral rane protein TerC [Bacteroidota bacterium]
MDFSVFGEAATWISLLTLTFMEIVLGIDNIIFISIIADRLPKKLQPRARNIGLLIAMILRLLLLLGIAFVLKMQNPFIHFNLFGKDIAPTGQSLILLGGGLFLIYKSISEIHHKLEGEAFPKEYKSHQANMKAIIIQITLINIVFSIDSIITAIGLTKIILVMMLSVILSIGIMMLFSGPVGNFVNRHPSMQMLGLSFLILIGFMLLIEGLHQMHAIGNGDLHDEIIPKGYLYFAIFFSLAVELLNIRFRKKIKKQ